MTLDKGDLYFGGIIDMEGCSDDYEGQSMRHKIQRKPVHSFIW